MGDIELVIKIPEDDYERLKEYKKAPFCSLTSRAYEAIANGTPLPKGHGDLVDRDAVNSRYDEICAELESLSNKPTYKELLDKLSTCLDTALPIIGADEESETKHE